MTADDIKRIVRNETDTPLLVTFAFLMLIAVTAASEDCRIDKRLDKLEAAQGIQR